MNSILSPLNFLGTILAVLLVLTGCHKDEPKIPVFSANVDNFGDPSAEYCLMIHDMNGKLLDYKFFHNNETFTLNSPTQLPGGRVTVTWMEVDASKTNFFLITYALVNTNGTWYLPPGTATPSPINFDGEFQVNINYNANPKVWSLSTLTGLTMETYSFDTKLHIKSLHMGSLTNYMLALEDINGNAGYAMLQNVNINDNIDFDFANLTPYDHTVNINFPVSDDYLLMVTALPDNLSDLYYAGNVVRLASGSFNGPQQTQMMAGYDNIFPKHKTTFTATSGNVHYEYIKTGTPPTGDVTISPQNPFTISHSGLSNFSLSTSSQFGVRFSTWQLQSGSIGAQWNVWSSSASQLINELPSEFASRYPGFNLNQFQHISSKLYVKSDTYDDFAQGVFSGSSGVPLTTERRPGAETLAISLPQ